MKTIGIRVEPSALTFVIFDTEANSIINVEKIKIPKALAVPQSLKYVRINLLDVLREYEVEQAGIRVTESNSQTLNIPRIQIEGVILEAFSSSSLKKYVCGQISSLSKLLGFDRADFKRYVDGTLTYAEVENWDSFSKVEKEACFAAIGAAHA